MILLIDNYDSFVHTLARYISEIGHAPKVLRNDALSVAEARALNPDAIIISPGPCTPREAGISVNLIETLGADIPILGVCLGHQCIAAAFGGDVVRAHKPVHGKQTPVTHAGQGIFEGLPNPLPAGRYHSLSVRLAAQGPLHATAYSDDNEIMALEHNEWPIWGVQFHPESVLSEGGHRLLQNFLKLGEEKRNFPPRANAS